MNPFADKHYLCLAGGGPKGHVYSGALKAINYLAPNFLASLRGVVGTSVGALFAVMIACRWSVDDMANYVSQITFTDLVELNLDWTNYGLDSGLKLYTLVDTFLEQAVGNKYVTFQQLQQRTGIQLVVVVANVDTCVAEYHGKTHQTLHLPIRDSVVASCSIPILFTPVDIRGQRYVDGGVVDNFAFHTFSMHHTLGLRFNCVGGSVTGLKSYLYRVLTLPIDKLAQEQFQAIPAFYRTHNIITFDMHDTPDLYYSSGVADYLKRVGFDGVYSFIEKRQTLFTLLLGMLVSCRTALLADWRAADSDSQCASDSTAEE